jgi:L,D-transpeptidase YcbB
MSKKIIIVPIFIALFGIGCGQNNNTGKSSNTKTTSGKTAGKPVVRDVSINKQNAYNDLFLDDGAVEKFIVSEKLNDTMASAIRDFYNARNFEFAWFESTGMIEQANSFHSLYCTENDCDVMNRPLEKRLTKYMSDEDSTIEEKDPATIKTELQTTVRFIRYAQENYRNKGISSAELGTYIPAKKATVLQAADALLANTSDNRTYDSLNGSFGSLKTSLRKYTNIARNGGWPVVVAPGKKYNVGARGPAVLAVKKRLQISGEYAAADTSDVFNAELEVAAKAYQVSHGYKPTGIVTPSLIKDMNITAMVRVQQLLINMQRMRWMHSQQEGRRIIVNIPEFELYMDSGKNILFQMDVVTGAEGHNTTMFSGDLSQVVFSPYWNVPPSIVKKEILPGIKRDKNYLKKKDMEITGHEAGLPVVRQLPGDKNALGKVKFLFPNSFNIYLHDTPEKGLFKKSSRGLSHGCIRLSDPVKLANYLLQNSKTWTPAKIDSAMNSRVEQFVKVKDPIPVIITYYTTWVDNNGSLRFADDIYGHDKKMAAKMFTDPQ